ncbi:DUF4153 domain-containing protein [Budviciaceae bacterium BWR-B9]|uniref:DUF4153 domain-containing protein n=1 Tax=Limnobaculum allomyrinae TaxID=2791986 RepID=A0ABS1IS31_9GAMM|nr:MULTISPECIES: DUF4153 domain-containing protein [Limnobaculum]MBK5144361.1 DUF4153 domain-containing protein [Limnobaculum allomyrinae]MBV7691894.1 DUF4153 domain-containing protein [Limnobaculum sp. M2-1]
MSDNSLPRLSRILIIFVCILQGFLTFIIHHGSGSSLLLQQNTILYWQALLLVLPLVFAFTIMRLRDRFLWQNLAICLLVILLTTTWVNWNVEEVDNISQYDGVVVPYLCSLCALMFIALPWLQTRIKNKQWNVSYATIYDHLCVNAITIIFTLLLIVLFWGILWLCVELFKQLDIHFFRHLFFRNNLFIYTINGFLIGMGIRTCRLQTHLMKAVRNLLTIMVKGLLPVLSFVALIFMATLPFVGLDALSATWSPSALLVTMVGLLITAINIVYKSGLKVPPYPTPVRLIVNASLLVLPLYAGLALYAISIRVNEYGWTPIRVWGYLVIIVSFFFSCSYAIAVIRSRRSWLHPLGSINRVLIPGCIVLLILINTPLIDPYRISVNDQMKRYQTGEVSADNLDLSLLRFNTGKRGQEALIFLYQDTSFVSNTQRKQRLERVMTEHNRWEVHGELEELKEIHPKFTSNFIQQKLVLAKNTEMPEENWWKMLQNNQQVDIDLCLRDSDVCVVNSLDLNQDGIYEYLLCHIERGSDISCHVFAKQREEWKSIGHAYFPPTTVNVTYFEQALKEGNVKARNKRWLDAEVGNEPVKIYYPAVE